MIPIRHIVLFICSITSALVTNAQNGEYVNVSLSAISLHGRILGIKYNSAGKTETLNVFQGKRTSEFRYNGPAQLAFFRESKEPGENGEPLITPVASLALPSKSGNYLLIFNKLAGSSEKYKVIPIKDDWNNFSAGSYRFLNLAPYDVVLKLDKDVHRISAKKLTDVKGSFSDNGNYNAAMVSLPANADPQKIFEGYMYFSKQIRMMYILFPIANEKPGAISMMAIPQTQAVKSAPLN